jgi:hypothetical protein
MKTQTKIERVTKHGQVKAHLIKKGSITSLDAINLYGATRLSAIIYNLRHNEGMTIVGDDVKTTDRNGNTCIFTKYRFVPKQN